MSRPQTAFATSAPAHSTRPRAARAAGLPRRGDDHRGRSRRGQHPSARSAAGVASSVVAALRARACAVVDTAVGRRRGDADRLVAAGPQRDRRLGDASTRWWRRRASGLPRCCCRVPVFSRDTYSYLAQGALLRDGFDPYVVGPDRQPELVAGQREPDLDDDDRPVRPRVHPGCQVRHHAGRRPRHRGHDAAATVHAARAGPADLGRTPGGPPRRRQRRLPRCGSACSTRW